MAQTTCGHCGAGFIARQPTQIYCSPRCKNSGGAKLRRERNALRAERRCYRCGETKPSSEFASLSQSYCRSCQNAYQREYEPSPISKAKRLKWRRENEPYDRRSRVQYLYGLTVEKYESLLRSQGGGCGVCKTTEPGGRWNTWHVDHNHVHCPGKRGCETCVRGLLCHMCNLALGYFRDDPQLLAAAIRYLAGERGATCP